MTRSEIPQLEVITAIPDAESEDFLAQLLFSQGWSIIHRALHVDSIQEFMEKRGLELRTVIVYQSDFPGFNSEILNKYLSPTITFISLDGIAFTSHEIMVAIRGKLRAPMVQPESEMKPMETRMLHVESASSERVMDAVNTRTVAPSSVSPSRSSSTIKRMNRPSSHMNAKEARARDRRIIAITGSTGAPGRTRFAAVLASELARQGEVLLIDADIRSHGIKGYSNSSAKNQVEILPLDRENRPTEIPDGDETTVVDLGTLPGLAEAVTDRRWHGSLVNNVLDRASQLIYLSKSTPTSMAELAAFLREYPLLLKRVPVAYVCVLSGHSRELREWESKFLSLTAGENRHILREGQLEPDNQGKGLGVASAFRLGNPNRKEIAKIAISLR